LLVSKPILELLLADAQPIRRRCEERFGACADIPWETSNFGHLSNELLGEPRR
jgi:hypothetical protein